MGEVYRATDTKLDRDVAIKVLPAAFTEDEARLNRFEREAKLLAQLHHPHIASIFGLEESDGVQALVMELIEGPTLADRLAGGPLLLDECLAIAGQIAEALEEAHEKGIIHRDLKPQNIKAPEDGKVKVLDFGLAKAMDPAGAGSGGAIASPTLMSSPTLTAMPGTQLGVILGTAAYMSPEQAKGKAVDKRADIWAFGVVLYEMLTGAKLFAAETAQETLAGVLKTEIDLEALPSETPSALRRLLRRCLERDPKRRLRDIGDARIVIDEVRSGVDRAEAAEGAAPRAEGRTFSTRRRIAWAVALAMLAAAAGWLARGALPGEGRSPASGLELRRLTELPGLETHPDISPDGRQFAYTSAAGGNNDVYLMRVDGNRAINLTANSPADGAFEPATGIYHPSDIPLAREEFSGFAGWLDDHRYLVRGAEDLAVVDVQTGAWRSLATIDGNRSRYWLGSDRRTLMAEVDSVDGDIWLLERPDDTVSGAP